MDDLVEELHKHSNYLYGENVADCRRLMRQAAVEIKRLRAAQVGAGDGAVGYMNLYRDERGDLSAGTVDLYESAEEAKDFSAADFEEHAGVFALVPVSVGADVGAGEDQERAEA